MSVLEYASKFIELSRFAPAFVADERLKMSRLKGGLNPDIKGSMLVLSVHLLRGPLCGKGNEGRKQLLQ